MSKKYLKKGVTTGLERVKVDRSIFSLVLFWGQHIEYLVVCCNSGSQLAELYNVKHNDKIHT